MATKEAIIAAKQFATERYIRSTHPVLYLPLWRLDGSPSIRSQDAFGHIGTVTDALWRPQGRYFDGANGIIVIPRTASLEPNPITIGAWVQITELDTVRRIFAKHEAGLVKAGYTLYRLNTDNKIYFQSGDSVTWPAWNLGSTKALAVGWHCIEAGQDSSWVSMFIDGEEAATAIAGGKIVHHTTHDLWIGGDTPTAFVWSGIIGATWIYNKAPNPTDHGRIYQATRWKFK